MAQNVCPVVCGEDRARLEAIVADRNRAHKHVLRARIVLHSADRLSVAEVARRVGVGRPAVWRWQRRFAVAGVDGLLREGSRKPGKTPAPEATVGRVVAMTCSEPPGEATHWTGRAMARATGLSLRNVQRIWAAHDLQPHRLKTFKRSNDPEFAAKLEAIVGLYLDPPAHSLVLLVDETAQIQALDRTQPGLPIKPGKAGKAGDGYLRRLLVNGARASTRWWRSRSRWLMALLARRPVNVATLALANKMARVIWVVLARGQVYRTAA